MLSAALAVSARQLQWWDEHHVVRPRHHGHRRYYDAGDAFEVAAIAGMRARGLSLQSIRKLLKFFKRYSPALTERLVGGSDAYVVAAVNGKSGLISFRAEDILRHAEDCEHPVVVFRLGPELRNLWAPPRKIQ